MCFSLMQKYGWLVNKQCIVSLNDIVQMVTVNESDSLVDDLVDEEDIIF